MSKQKKPFIPGEREATIRQDIIRNLEEHSDGLTAKELSHIVGVKEKDVYEHLSHIERSFAKSSKGVKKRFWVLPSECNKCGYVFEDRSRLTKPGKCPECKGTTISAPVFGIEGKK